MDQIFLRFLLILLVTSRSIVAFCPPLCSCSDTVLSVDCKSSGSLRVVPIFLNPQIKFLSLAQNQIEEITMSLTFYGELQALDLSQNTIITLGSGNFENLSKLSQLNVSYNALSALESRAFKGLGKITELDLSGNQIERIEKEVFEPMIQLQYLYLDRNRLEFLDWDLFKNLDNLVYLSVKYNFVQMLEPQGSSPHELWTLKNIKFFDISSNQLTRVKNESLAIFSKNLQNLQLCCNYIHTVEPGAFAHFSQGQLVKVNLSQNRLSRVPSESLEILGQNLKILDLSSNRLVDSLPSRSFGKLEKLEILHLSDNPGLVEIDPQALQDNIGLEQVYLDNLANLTEISAQLLRNKPNLQIFSVKFASISSLSRDFFQPQELLIKYLQIQGNPLDCNCSTVQLFKFIRSRFEGQNIQNFPQNLDKNSSTSTDPFTEALVQIANAQNSMGDLLCHSPEGQRGILVKDLKNSDFTLCPGLSEEKSFIFSLKDIDSFQLLVICISISILSIILIVLGVKLCCFCDKSEKPEKYYTSSTITTGNEYQLPLPPICMGGNPGQNHFVNLQNLQNHGEIQYNFPSNGFNGNTQINGKLTQNPRLFYANANGFSTTNGKTTTSTTRNNGRNSDEEPDDEEYDPRNLNLRLAPVPDYYYSPPSYTMGSKAKFRHNFQNFPQNCPPLPSKEPPPLILHYGISSNSSSDYSSDRIGSQKRSNSSYPSSSLHRTKHNPSVLV